MGNSNSKDHSKQANKPPSSLSIPSTVSTASSSNVTLPHHSGELPEKPLPLCQIINPKDDENYEDILLGIQEQLLLLHHSYSCPYKNHCPCTSQCAATKSLLHHIATCTEGQKCPVPHCQSNRDILRHFYNCSDEQCECCFPVWMVMADAMQRRRRPRPRRAIRNITTVGRPNIFTPARTYRPATTFVIKKIPYY